MEFFTRDWVETFAHKWNHDTAMMEPLAQIGFSAVVGLGYSNREEPSVLLEILNGKILRAGLYQKAAQLPALAWDLRALPEQWLLWQRTPLTLSTVSLAVQNQQLRFKVGDYRQLIRTPGLAQPFLRFFKIL